MMNLKKKYHLLSYNKKIRIGEIKKMNYWIDIDGVLAIYEPHAYKGTNPIYLRPNAHYYRGVVADNRMLRAAKLLLAQKPADSEVFSLSGVSPIGNMFTEQVSDKKYWLRLHIEELNVETNFFPAVSEKRNVVAMLTGKNARNLSYKEVLVDDYNPNLEAWSDAGGTAVKYLNGINSADSWNGLKITERMTSEEICDMLLSINIPKF